jgi:hypothetical protein
MVLGILACITAQRPWGTLRRRATRVRHQGLHVLEQHWQVLGVMAMACIDLIIQGPRRGGLTNQRRASWAYRRAPWGVCAAFGHGASAMQRLKKGRPVGKSG